MAQAEASRTRTRTRTTPIQTEKRPLLRCWSWPPTVDVPMPPNRRRRSLCRSPPRSTRGSSSSARPTRPNPSRPSRASFCGTSTSSTATTTRSSTTFRGTRGAGIPISRIGTRPGISGTNNRATANAMRTTGSWERTPIPRPSPRASGGTGNKNSECPCRGAKLPAGTIRWTAPPGKRRATTIMIMTTIMTTIMITIMITIGTTTTMRKTTTTTTRMLRFRSHSCPSGYWSSAYESCGWRLPRWIPSWRLPETTTSKTTRESSKTPETNWNKTSGRQRRTSMNSCPPCHRSRRRRRPQPVRRRLPARTRPISLTKSLASPSISA
mmetsp:Transcript_7822/g.22980  ORF Transcript_7822/g.22980 Transcript_7822/m.22980 type:complete len:324 (-) Transcript_7822:3523-4494(-)